MGFLMRRLIGFIKVIRLHNIAVAVLSVFVGSALAGQGRPQYMLLVAAAAAAGAGNVINDIYDIDIDRINKPSRPLPSGILSMRSVWILYALLVIALILSALTLPFTQAAWVIVWAVLLHLYARSLKRAFLAGNLLVSAVSASGFMLGAYSAGNSRAGIIPAAYTFFFVLGRELVKDCQDIEGDRSCGSRTVPIVSGERKAGIAAVILFAALALLFPVPFFRGIYSLPYGVIMFAGVIPILAVSILFTVRGERLGAVSSLLKTGMFLGVAAFYFGSKG
jgi:geranylgeranylglycerol-phosphate geranylgeranyltransferase